MTNPKKHKGIKIVSIKKNNIVVKSNQIIEAKYKLNLVEQKIILFLISLIEKEDEVFKLWKIKISELSEFLGLNSKSSYRELKNATYKMMDRKLKLKSPDRELQLNWLASADYFNNEGVVELEISEKLKPFLLQLRKEFTKLNLKTVVSLKSVYSIRFYELLKQYEKLGKRYFELTELKEILLIADKYKRYIDFKKKIILPAQKELRHSTDLSFEFEVKKHVRKVVGITFFINNKSKSSIDSDIQQPENNNELFKRLQEYFKQSDEQVKWILGNVNETDLLLALDFLEKRYKKKEIQNLGAYTWGYFNKGQYKTDVEQSRFDIEKKEKEAQKRKEKLRKELEEKLEQDYEKYVNNCIKDFEFELSDNAKEELKTQAEHKIKENNPALSNQLRKSFSKIEYRMILCKEAEKQNLITPFDEWKEKEIKKMKKSNK